MLGKPQRKYRDRRPDRERADRFDRGQRLRDEFTCQNFGIVEGKFSKRLCGPRQVWLQFGKVLRVSIQSHVPLRVRLIRNRIVIRVESDIEFWREKPHSGVRKLCGSAFHRRCAPLGVGDQVGSEGVHELQPSDEAGTVWTSRLPIVRSDPPGDDSHLTRDRKRPRHAQLCEPRRLCRTSTSFLSQRPRCFSTWLHGS